jgi:17beta-estradiol 17-dehydrogenase / very-long-chain 3-oxoacyl-CoA reductase
MIRRYGKDSWALVTGATDGIGKAFCEELAIIGFNIILVSRNAEKLKKVAKQVRELNSNIKTVEVEFDFDKRNQLEDYLSVFDKDLTEKYDISIVVNNVGTDYHKPWAYFSYEETFRLINLNIKPQTMLTKIFLEKLLNRSKVKDTNKNNPSHCAFINLSSFCSDFPFPGKSLYSSTKIFDHYLSHALREEYINSKIDFISFKPLGVATPLTPKPCDYVSILPARQCVRSCLDDLVHESETYGHWLHKIQAVLINCVPNFILHPFLRHCWYSLVMNIKFDKEKKKN